MLARLPTYAMLFILFRGLAGPKASGAGSVHRQTVNVKESIDQLMWRFIADDLWPCGPDYCGPLALRLLPDGVHIVLVCC
jgi:hypothetical protein